MPRKRRLSTARTATPWLRRLGLLRHRRLALLAAAVLALWWFLHGPGRPEPSPDHAPHEEPGGAAAIAPAPPPAEIESRAAEADHLAGFLHAARQSAAEGRWGKAFAALDQAAASPLTHAELAERIRACERELVTGLDAAVEQIATSLSAGTVLLAADALERLREPADARVERALAALSAHHWPWFAPSLPSAASTPADVTPLADGRGVRLRFRGAWAVGRVVAWRNPTDAVKAEATIEVTVGTTRSYGIVRRAALEPVEPSLPEAIDQARTARCAGDAALFAAWIATCHRLGGAEHEAVVELLAGLPR